MVMSFYKKREETFKTTNINIIIFFVLLVVFLWGFFFDSFTPITYMHNGIEKTTIKISMVVFIAPLFIIYELLYMVLLPGKKRGKYLPWALWYQIFKYKAKTKFIDGIQETKDWMKRK